MVVLSAQRCKGALSKLATEVNYNAELIDAVDSVNNRQKFVVSNKVITRFGEDLGDYTFCVWGLSFKPELDDMRESSSLYVINELLKRGATVNAYDPKATYEAKSHYFKDLPRLIILSINMMLLKIRMPCLFLLNGKSFCLQIF